MNISGAASAYPNDAFRSLFSDAGDTSQTLERVRSETSTQADFEIVTADGDRVSFSATAESRSAYSTYTATGQFDDGTLSRSSSSSQTYGGRAIELTIAGELDDQERAEISSLLEFFGEAVSGFSAGDDDAASGIAESIAGLQTISSVQGSISSAATVQRDQVARITRSSGDAEHVETAPQREAVALDADAQNKVDHLVERMMKRFDHFESRLGRRDGQVSNRLSAFMAGMLRKMGNAEGVDSGKRKLAGLVAEQLIQRISSSTEDEAQDGPTDAGTPDAPPTPEGEAGAVPQDPTSETYAHLGDVIQVPDPTDASGEREPDEATPGS